MPTTITAKYPIIFSSHITRVEGLKIEIDYFMKKDWMKTSISQIKSACLLVQETGYETNSYIAKG